MLEPYAVVAKAVADRSFFDWVYAIFINYWPLFLKGAGITLLIAITGTLVGSVVGLVIGVIRTIPLQPNSSVFKRAALKTINGILSLYIEVFRGTPMIVQAMVIYYGLASIGIYLNIIFAGFFIVSINTGAYMAEIVRGGIISIDKGQFEAAHSIGMNHSKTMLFIVLPQVIRNILPATGNEFVINIKDTAVLSVISVTELFFQAKSIAGSNLKYFPVFMIASAFYLIMTFTVSRTLRFIERRMDGSDTYTIHGSHTIPESEFKVTREGNDK